MDPVSGSHWWSYSRQNKAHIHKVEWPDMAMLRLCLSVHFISVSGCLSDAYDDQKIKTKNKITRLNDQTCRCYVCVSVLMFCLCLSDGHAQSKTEYMVKWPDMLMLCLCLSVDVMPASQCWRCVCVSVLMLCLRLSVDVISVFHWSQRQSRICIDKAHGWAISWCVCVSVLMLCLWLNVDFKFVSQCWCYVCASVLMSCLYLSVDDMTVSLCWCYVCVSVLKLRLCLSVNIMTVSLRFTEWWCHVCVSMLMIWLCLCVEVTSVS